MHSWLFSMAICILDLDRLIPTIHHSGLDLGNKCILMLQGKFVEWVCTGRHFGTG
jgi:hypothetical protein